MKDRIPDGRLASVLMSLKRWSGGRQDGDIHQIRGAQIRELIDVCKDLQDARSLLEKTAWLRKPEKKKK